jgi:hypothetical protein
MFVHKRDSGYEPIARLNRLAMPVDITEVSKSVNRSRNGQ